MPPHQVNSSGMKPGAQFETKRVSGAIQCQANKPKMTHKEIHTADLHLGTSAETWSTPLEKQRQEQVWCHSEACRPRSSY